MLVRLLVEGLLGRGLLVLGQLLGKGVRCNGVLGILLCGAHVCQEEVSKAEILICPLSAHCCGCHICSGSGSITTARCSESSPKVRQGIKPRLGVLHWAAQRAPFAMLGVLLSSRLRLLSSGRRHLLRLGFETPKRLLAWMAKWRPTRNMNLDVRWSLRLEIRLEAERRRLGSNGMAFSPTHPRSRPRRIAPGLVLSPWGIGWEGWRLVGRLLLRLVMVDAMLLLRLLLMLLLMLLVVVVLGLVVMMWVLVLQVVMVLVVVAMLSMMLVGYIRGAESMGIERRGPGGQAIGPTG